MSGKEKCSMPRVKAEQIEPLVWEAVADIIRHPENLAQIVEKQQVSNQVDGVLGEVVMKDIEAQIKLKEREKDRILTLYSRGTLGLEDVEAQLSRIDGERDRLKRRLFVAIDGHAKTTNDNISLDFLQRGMYTISNKLDGLEPQEKAKVLRYMIDRVTVNYDGTHTVKIYIAIPSMNQPSIPICDSLVSTKTVQLGMKK